MPVHSSPMWNYIHSPLPRPGHHPKNSTQRGKCCEEGLIPLPSDPLTEFLWGIRMWHSLGTFSTPSTKHWLISWQAVFWFRIGHHFSLMYHWTKLKISSRPDTKHVFQWRWTSSWVQKEDWNMSWQREKRGRNQPKQGTKKRRENRAALLVQQNFLLENAGVSHRVHPSTQSTDFLCLLPPLFSNVSTWKSCFSPQTSVNFPSLQKKKKRKKERKHSPNK